MQICGQPYKGCHKFNSKVIFKLTMSSTELTGYEFSYVYWCRRTALMSDTCKVINFPLFV